MSYSRTATGHHLPLEAIFFDLGGTLIYFQGEWPVVMHDSTDALFRSLESDGLTVDQNFLSRFRDQLEQYRSERDSEFIEYTTAYILRNLLVDSGHLNVPEAVLKAALRAMYKVSQAYWQPEADAAPTLSILRQQGYHLGLISNAADDADVQALVDKAGLRAYFDLILSSAAIGIRKPNPRIFQTALDSVQIQPEKAAMIGDALGADILGAHNAGLLAVWITRRADTSANRAHQDTIQPDATISTLSELPSLLESYKGLLHG